MNSALTAITKGDSKASVESLIKLSDGGKSYMNDCAFMKRKFTDVFELKDIVKHEQGKKGEEEMAKRLS